MSFRLNKGIDVWLSFFFLGDSRDIVRRNVVWMFLVGPVLE